MLEELLLVIRIIGNVMKQKRKTKKQGVNTRKDVQGIDSMPDISSNQGSKDDSNLIMVGGLAGVDEHVSPASQRKTFMEFRSDVNLALLTEKKNQKKRRSKKSGTEPMDDRKKKLRDLRQDDSLWSGLE